VARVRSAAIRTDTGSRFSATLETTPGRNYGRAGGPARRSGSSRRTLAAATGAAGAGFGRGGAGAGAAAGFALTALRALAAKQRSSAFSTDLRPAASSRPALGDLGDHQERRGRASTSRGTTGSWTC
jgi:hypothetical protein